MVSGVPLKRRASLPLRRARLVTMGVSALALTLGLTVPNEAEAQFFFDGFYNSPYPKKPKVKRSRPAYSSRGQQSVTGDRAPEKIAERKPDSPLVITVSLRRQRVSVWDQTGLVMEAPISSGRVGHATPTGVFSILQKNRVHFSNLYDSAPMPNMQRITWSGVALHAGVLPGYPASHGCIRLPHSFSKRLFEVTSLGTRVIVSHDPVQPQSFSHPRLFAAYPDHGTSMHALLPAETRVADASDMSPVGPPSEVGSIVGMSTAVAAEAPSRLEAIQALRADRRVEMERLAAATQSAEVEKAKAVANAAARVKVSEEKKQAVRSARMEASRLATEARKASQAAKTADDKLEAFAKAMLRKSEFSPEQAEKAAADEDKLEALALDLADKALAAKAAADSAATALAAAEQALLEADKARAEVVNAARAADQRLAAAREAEAAAKRREAKRKEPVHVFISRKTQKVYVRQGYEPILEAPVTIAEPDQPLGTHVFTALAVDPAKADVNWSVASIPTYMGGKITTPRNRKEREAAAAEAERLSATARGSQTAEAALQRVVIPEDVRLTIEDVMKPGSSLIVSDNGLSNETGKFTDFIVPVR
jgi:lipoprotein-anchoring transpeptidase ErfK/SrfK